MFEGSGFISSESRDLASYDYQWVDGHEARFSLAVAPFDESESLIGLTAVSCRKTSDELIFSVLDAADSPWAETEVLRPFLGREEILERGAVPGYFALVDAIVANEPRLAARIIGT
jgi:hypothetical protein